MSYQKTLTGDQIKLFEIKVIITMVGAGVLNALGMLPLVFAGAFPSYRAILILLSLITLGIGNVVISFWLSTTLWNTFWRTIR